MFKTYNFICLHYKFNNKINNSNYKLQKSNVYGYI